MLNASLDNNVSRTAVKGERLMTSGFHSSTTFGFCSEGEPEVTVRVPSGTKLDFDWPIAFQGVWALVQDHYHEHSKTARFRQISLGSPRSQHDAIELDSGRIVLLDFLRKGQTATVLQLPAKTMARS